MAEETPDVSNFSVDIRGDKTRKQFVGAFTVKTLLSHRDELRRDAIRRDLLGPAAQFATDRAMNQADVLSELAVRIAKAPTWWTENGNGLDLKDDNVVARVYEEALKAEKDVLAKLIGEGEKAKEELRESTKAAP